jgi:glucoamylase
MGLIVTSGKDFFSEEKRHAVSRIYWLEDGVPAFRLVNTCNSGYYRIEKQVVTDPHRDTVLQHVRFIPTKGNLSDYNLYALLAPHLGNHGSGNTAWTDEFEGKLILFAQRNGYALAMACSIPWLKRSVGYVGSSDGWQDLKLHKQMTWEFTRAENGNVALIGEIDHLKSHGEFVLAVGFGSGSEEAARNAVASLRDGMEKAKHDYLAGWQEWMNKHVALRKTELHPVDLSRISLAVLHIHKSKASFGGIIASLSIPWGFSKGDNDLGGYHLVWSRDMVETAGGLLAAGANEGVHHILSYLEATQRPDGHWPQNMWLDGTPYWDGIQMDETALPVLLVDLANREKALRGGDLARFWPMVKKAAGYLILNGPVSPQDRWEEDPGYSPFTISAEIAALLAAADLAELNHEAGIAVYLRETADVWNASIERWIYMSDSDWCRQFSVGGYYVRITSIDSGEDMPQFGEVVHIKNVSSGDTLNANHLVSPDALSLVRFGLRAADDPRILNTIKVIDALLKVETPSGPTWHRYNNDGYGEHEDGSPFDGTGIGRGWPLLTGERAHYELAAGHVEKANLFLSALESFANEGGLIPEQVWDSPDIPERELFFGKPSGSAMPLVWAHAEYLKLLHSLQDGQVFDMPPQTVKRYIVENTQSPRMIWRFNHKISSIEAGKILRIEVVSPAIIHWSFDDWNSVQDTSAVEVGLGIYTADLITQKVPEGKQIQFTFYWSESGTWEGTNFNVKVKKSAMG